MVALSALGAAQVAVLGQEGWSQGMRRSKEVLLCVFVCEAVEPLQTVTETSITTRSLLGSGAQV